LLHSRPQLVACATDCGQSHNTRRLLARFPSFALIGHAQIDTAMQC